MFDFNLFKNELNKIISFPTVKSEKVGDAPFGLPLKEALKHFLSLAESFGFETINYDNYAGEIFYGEGEEIGVIGHLDVVPASNGWTYPPFSLTEENNKLYGRGVEDDKGPSLLFLFALKELKESNVKFNKKIRFFIGCDEENDWQDVDYIRTKTTLPEYGFSPDGNFPVTYAEKGVYKIKIKLPDLNNFKYLPCGKALNAVCDYAELKILNEKINLPKEKFSLMVENDKVVSHGLSAHGSMPENGKNAIKPLFLLLKECGEKDLNEFISLFDSDTFLFYSEQGKVTLSPNLITEFGKNFFLECDVRVPAPLTVNLVKEVLDKKGFEYEIVEKLPPVMVEKDGWFINSLLSAYKSVTGKKNAKAEAMGGSTFGRAFSKGCSFGVSEKGMSDNIHGDNEWISQDWLKKCFEIYKQALYNIVK